MRRYLLVLIGSWLLLYSPYQSRPRQYIEITAKDATLYAETVMSRSEKQAGLSHREKLLPHRAMLFVHSTPDHHGIWMKAMKIPIDIIWLNSEKEIIHIKKSALPASYPEVFKPATPALYVIETNAGFTDKYSLTIGDRVEFKL